MIQKYFKFIEDTYDGQNTIIFPFHANYQAYRILLRAFPPALDSSYFVVPFEITTDKTDGIDYDKLNLNKDIRVCNGLIDCHKLRKWVADLENGDDNFQNLGILSICAYFPTVFV